MNRAEYNSWRVATDFNGYLNITAPLPCDARLVCWDRADALSKTAYKRYQGMKIFFLSDQKEYWFRDGTEDANLVEYKPWPAQGSGSATPIFTIDRTADSCERNAIATYLDQNASNDATVGSEANVIYTDDGSESFLKFVKLTGGWAILDGSQIITFVLSAYNDWAEWTAPSNTAKIKYQKGTNAGSVTVMVKHNFCTSYVDTTFFVAGTGDVNNDNLSDTYGEKILVNSRCTTLSGESGYWVVLDFQLPLTDSAEPESYTYTLLLQR